MKYLVCFIMSIVLLACNGNKTPKNEHVNPWIKKAPYFKPITWRSIQTIDAHDEEDAIAGNFTGKGIDICKRYYSKANFFKDRG